ncbi:hypothetical protein [Paenibacillus naphthalenovorans]|uniref:Uncharacterized protein n=1 Tax=Paenibacillus naphthalenovorans TaxID=162209 RepID=A0A0U2W3X1_9BACL|nr:hypothetical protein [Paenibacillus naphthalenovorans]ALS22181.1 hypothetical protein IJ22_18070 [Paenibacillus naphthalenovorans]
MKKDKIKVHFYCGMYRGEPKWRYGYDWYKEPEECYNEGIIEVDKIDWEEESVSYICPECKNELYQSDGHFELVSE